MWIGATVTGFNSYMEIPLVCFHPCCSTLAQDARSQHCSGLLWECDYNMWRASPLFPSSSVPILPYFIPAFVLPPLASPIYCLTYQPIQRRLLFFISGGDLGLLGESGQSHKGLLSLSLFILLHLPHVSTPLLPPFISLALSLPLHVRVPGDWPESCMHAERRAPLCSQWLTELSTRFQMPVPVWLTFTLPLWTAFSPSTSCSPGLGWANTHVCGCRGEAWGQRNKDELGSWVCCTLSALRVYFKLTADIKGKA